MLRQETLEYLSEYETDESKVSLLFLELGEDPDAEEYPDDIIERAEQFYVKMGKAKQKVLAAGQKDTAIAVQEISQMTFQLLEQQGISLPIEIIAALAQSKVEEAIELADKLSDLQERAFVTRSTHNNARFAQRLLGLSEQSTEIIDAVLGDEAQVEWIASSTPATQLNGEVQKFLNGLDARKKARNQIGVAKTETVAALPQQEPKKFLKTFLAARNV